MYTNFLFTRTSRGMTWHYQAHDQWWGGWYYFLYQHWLTFRQGPTKIEISFWSCRAQRFVILFERLLILSKPTEKNFTWNVTDQYGYLNLRERNFSYKKCLVVTWYTWIYMKWNTTGHNIVAWSHLLLSHASLKVRKIHY